VRVVHVDGREIVRGMMEDRAVIFGKTIDVLTGQKSQALAWELQAYVDRAPYFEIRRRKHSDGRTMSKTMAREFSDRMDAAFSINCDIGDYQERRITVGLPTVHHEKLKAIMDDLDPGGLTSTPAAFRPAVQREELRELKKKIEAVQICFRALNWETKERLHRVRPSRTWKYLDTMLNNAAAATEAVTTPNPRGGRVASTIPIQLVEFCLETFNEWKPGKATSTLGGGFSDYVSAVHSLATGEPKTDFGRRIRAVL